MLAQGPVAWLIQQAHSSKTRCTLAAPVVLAGIAGYLQSVFLEVEQKQKTLLLMDVLA